MKNLKKKKTAQYIWLTTPTTRKNKKNHLNETLISADTK